MTGSSAPQKESKKQQREKDTVESQTAGDRHWPCSGPQSTLSCLFSHTGLSAGHPHAELLPRRRQGWRWLWGPLKTSLVSGAQRNDTRELTRHVFSWLLYFPVRASSQQGRHSGQMISCLPREAQGKTTR